MNTIKRRKTIAIISISVVIMVILIILYNIFKPKYKPFLEYEKMNDRYQISLYGDYLYKSGMNKVYSLKNIDPDIMIIATMNTLWGANNSNLYKATDSDIDPLEDWEIEEIFFNGEKSISDINLINSIKYDLFKESINENELNLKYNEKTNNLMFIHVKFKKTDSIYAYITIKEGEEDFYYVLKEEDELVYKTVNKDVKEVLYSFLD